MKTFKKLFSVTAILALLTTTLPNVAFAASYSDELEGAYDYAYDNGITTMDSIDNADLYGSLTRIAMAKMMANYAVDVLGLTPDTDLECSFPDVSEALDAQYDNGVTNACQLGLMGVGVTNFDPYGLVNRAQFGTVLSRALYGEDNNGGNPYYADHLNALEEAGIMNNISNPDMLEVRGYVMLMMQRGAEEETTEGCSAEELLACITADDYDDCIAECSDVEEEEVVVELNGNLSVELSDDTADSTKLPKGAQGVRVATFTLEADEDIDLFSVDLEISGMGAAAAIEDVALFTEDGRVSKTKSFNSDDEAVVVFSPVLTLKAGQKVELTAVVSTKAGADAGDEFAISLKAIDSSAEDLDANFPLTAETMEIGSETATPITVAFDGTVSDVKVGEKDAEILKFKVTNASITKEDVKLSSLTFKENGTIDEEDELSNFTLWYDGEEIATVDSTNDKYLTFNLDDAVLIEDGKTEKFVVTANIDGGAADPVKTIQFYIDKTLDVMVTASKYGYVSITNNLGTAQSTAVDVEAGELSIVTTEPTMTEIRKDKDNLVIGEIKFVSAAGKNLELDDFKLVLNEDDAGGDNLDWLDIFDNIELYNKSAGGVYDLSCLEITANNNHINSETLTCSDTDMGVSIKEGTTIFQIRLDTQDVAANGVKFHATVDVANHVVVRETDDDTRVTDVTPSALSYKSITIEDSSATITSLALPAAKSAVIGSQGVVLHKFEVKAGDSSDIEIDEMKLLGAVVDNLPAGTANFDNTRVNSVKLYKDEVTSANLLDTVAGSQLASNYATFNNFKVTVEKGEKRVFYVTTDIINDVNQAADTITARITSVSAEDSDNDDITVSGTPAISTSTLTVKGVGTLDVVVDNTDSATNKAKNVLGGTTSDFVASYEFTAVNEGVLVKDLQLDQTAGGIDLQDAVSEVILYANDKTTELARKSVSSDTVTFDNIDFVVEEGNENVYVKVVTSKMGKDQAGEQTAELVLKLTVTDADGADSNKVVSNPAQTAASNAFSVLPVRISSVAFVSTYGGISVASKLTNGSNNIAIIAVTTDASTNTDDTDGSSLKTLLTQIKMKESKLAATSVASYTIEKVNGDASTVAATVAGGYVTFDTTAVGLGSDDEIDNGTTVYYVVKANVTKDGTNDNDDYLKVEFDAFNASQVKYVSDSTSINNTPVTDLRIGLTKLDGTQINE